MIGDERDPGLIPRAVTKLFEAKRDIENSGHSLVVNIQVAILEIYNEKLRDLLADDHGQLLKFKLGSNKAGEYQSECP